MTEPDVLGNVSPAIFIWETGNTEIINLWKPDKNNAVQSLNHRDAGTREGQNYLVPASRVFYLLFLECPFTKTGIDLYIQANTTPDTSTGGTTVFRTWIPDSDPSAASPIWINQYNICCKFVAGEYVTEYMYGSADEMLLTGWGVECAA